MLTFNGLLQGAGIDPATTRLVRHRHKPLYQRAVYLDAIRRNTRFEQYQAGQGNPTVISQMASAATLAAFVVDPRRETVFVGIWQVKGSRPGHMPDPYKPPAPPSANSTIIDLERIPILEDYCGRVVVDWGGGGRAWVQYAHRRDKEIIELRRHAEEPPFPGFGRFTCGLHEVDTLPVSWLAPLQVTRGIYLLVHRETGAQYVGSATGGDGFLGRWLGYADGHGGNLGLRELAHPADHYDVRILETAGSAATREDIYDLESLWKEKLGSRAQGLNRN